MIVDKAKFSRVLHIVIAALKSLIQPRSRSNRDHAPTCQCSSAMQNAARQAQYQLNV